MFATRFITFLAAALVAIASPLPEKRAGMATVYSSCINPKQVALTFDDGPWIYHQQLVDLLVANGVKGSFFFNGNNYACIYDADTITRVKYAYSHGMMVGDHTWSHADLTTLSTVQIQDAMYRMEEAFSRILGIKPGFMRPPYGNYNDNILQIAFQRNQSVAMWDQDTEDADGATVAFSENVYQTAVNSKLNNMLVLNHETIETTSTKVMPFAIPLLKNAGYTMVTLAECVGVQPYAAIGTPQVQDSTWTCDGTPDPGAACGGSIPCLTGTPILLNGTPIPTTTSTTTTSTSTTSTSTTSTTSTTTTTSAGSTTTGQVIHPSASNSQCLAAGTTDGSSVTLQNCDGSAGQSWTRSGNTWQINGKCLTVPGGSTTNGVKMTVSTCTANNANQQFTSTGNTIVWSGKNECLDLTDGSLTNGNVIQMWQCFTGNTNQMWNVGTGTTTPPPTTTTTTTGPTSTAKTIRPSSNNNLCLGASSNADGASVTIQTCSANSQAQAWTVTGGTITLFGNKCLDDTDGLTTQGNKLQIWTCGTGNPNQKFAHTGNTIVWTGHNECVQLTSTTNSVQTLRTCSGATNQNWNFV